MSGVNGVVFLLAVVLAPGMDIEDTIDNLVRPQLEAALEQLESDPGDPPEDPPTDPPEDPPADPPEDPPSDTNHLTFIEGSRALWWEDGTPFFEAGANDPEWLMADYFTQAERFHIVDYLDSMGINTIYFGLVNDCHGDGLDSSQLYRYTPWADNDCPIADFADYDQDFLDDVEELISYMEDRDMVAHVVVYLDDTDGIAGDITDAEEEAFFRHIVNLYKHHQNIVWNIAEEWNKLKNVDGVDRFDEARVEELAGIIREEDPIHAITALPLTGTDFVFADSGVPGFYAAHQFNSDWHKKQNDEMNKIWDQIEDSGTIVPMSLTEWEQIEHTDADCDRARKVLWAVSATGATFQLYARFDDTGDEIEDWETCWEYADMVKDFMVDNVPWYDMEPANHLVDNGYALANDDKIMVYLPDGGDVFVSAAGAWDYDAFSAVTGQPISSSNEGERVLLLTKI